MRNLCNSIDWQTIFFLFIQHEQEWRDVPEPRHDCQQQEQMQQQQPAGLHHHLLHDKECQQHDTQFTR